jgi:uncharacterized LabA/DUF88 family protein
MYVAILVDWDNIKKRIFSHPKLREKYNFANEKFPMLFIGFVKSFLNEEEKLYRIFFYTASPYKANIAEHFMELENYLRKEERISEDELKNIKKGIVEKIEKGKRKLNSFLERIAGEEYIALRLGKVVFDGWDFSKRKPKFRQKKVDMLLGLDIAHLSYKYLVKRILVFSYDTDIQPALKIARMEGLQVILPIIKEDGIPFPPKELKKHADLIREKTLEEINKYVDSYISGA